MARGAPVVPAGAAFRRWKSFLALEGLASLENREHVPGRVLAVVGPPLQTVRGMGGGRGVLPDLGAVWREVFQAAY